MKSGTQPTDLNWNGLSEQTLASVLVAGISFLLFIWMGRMLGAEAFGYWGVALSWLTLGMLLLDGGFRTLIFREGTAGQLKDTVVDLALGHWLLVGVAGSLCVLWFVEPEQRWLASGGILCGLTATLVAFRSALLKAQGRFRDDAVWQVACRSASALCIVVALILYTDAVIVFWAWALGLLLCLASAWRWLAGARPKLDRSASIYKPMLALILVEASVIIHLRVDLIVLEHLAVPGDAIGSYAIAAKVLEAVAFLITPLGMVFFRQIRLRWVAGQPVLASLRNPLIMTLPVGGMLLLGPQIFGDWPWTWLMGSDFAGTGAILSWLMLAAVVMLPNALLAQIVLATHREWLYVSAMLVTAGANLVFNLWWIPEYGVFGAAMATVAAEVALFAGLVTAALVHRRRHTTPFPVV